MIKMVISDVDGTLVKESSGYINPEYYEVIRDLHAKGIQVVVASGRPYSSIHSLFKPVEDIIWYVADGGAAIKTIGELEVVSEIPRSILEEAWLDIAKIPGMDGICCGKNCVYAPDTNSEMYQMLAREYKMKMEGLGGWDYIPDEKFAKFSLFRFEDIEKYANMEFLPKWKDKLHMVIAGEWWLDCMLPGVNKGSALQTIMDRHGYVREEVMATGDNMNDYEMIELAGTGVAVSTARDEVKAVAAYTIGNYEDDSVLKEWKKLL
ncbi:MAG: HAD family hydrolase [Lachnospiraceae bacterium]